MHLVYILVIGAYLSPALAMVLTGVSACWVSWNASLFLYGEEVQTHEFQRNFFSNFA